MIMEMAGKKLKADDVELVSLFTSTPLILSEQQSTRLYIKTLSMAADVPKSTSHQLFVVPEECEHCLKRFFVLLLHAI